MNSQTIDERAVLALNQAHQTETSALDADRLHDLLDQAFHVGLCDQGRDAFLIALDQSAVSSSPNFQWFKSRYPRFVYIDRVIVASSKRGLGLASGLYRELFAAAADDGHVLVGCEVNLEPPNRVSDAFHEALRFSEVGRAAITDGKKVVRYLARAI
jgi:predicted GNAT superfamily acetyltransferase